MNDALSIFNELTKQNENFAVQRKSVSDYKSEIDLHDKGQLIKPIRTGIPQLDFHFNFCEGQLVLLTGYPQSGKSEFSKFLAVNFCKNHNGKAVIFTPESRTPVFLYELIVLASEMGLHEPEQYINEHISIIEINDMNGMPNLDQILTEFDALALEDYKFFVIDPMNWLTSNTYQSNTMYEALRITLTRLKQFAHRIKGVVVYIEHPKTPHANKDGSYPACNVFMVNGGVMHNNKCDAILILHRNKGEQGEMSDSDMVDIEVAKLKDQRYLGRPSTVTLNYDWKTGRYY